MSHINARRVQQSFKRNFMGHHMNAILPPSHWSTSWRVLLVSPRYFPYMGGVETHVYEVARRFAGRGVDVTVLTTDTSRELPPQEDVEGVHVIRVPAYPKNRDYYFAPQLLSVIGRREWDIVHCQSFHTFVPPLAMLAAKRANMPYLLSFHSGGHSSKSRHALRSLQAKLMRPLLKGAKRLVAVSKFEAQLFQERLQLPSERFVVIPNGSHLPKVTVTPITDHDAPLILSVGRLEAYKGHHRVLQALPRILEQRPNARLRIVGSGPYEPALRDMANTLGVAEQTEIGAIPPGNREGMANALMKASLVTLLSEYEAHPIAVMEALSLQRPVLVADTSGLSELAQRGLVSAIPLESTSDQVADAVLDQLRSPRIPTEIELPTWDQCADALLSLYAAVIEENR